jgi:hypothetical protein
MVQLKTTPTGGDGKGKANNGSKRGGTSESSLAKASALSRNSSPRPQGQGKGGSRNQTIEITGPTDNINRGGRKVVDPSNKPTSTQKMDGAKERTRADGQESNKPSQG